MESKRQRKYAKYLQSVHWMKLRRRVLIRDGKQCVLCGSTDELQAHHETYREKFRDSLPDDLVTLCRECHEEQHGLSKSSSQPQVAKPLRHSIIATCSISVFRSSLDVGVYYDGVKDKWIVRS